MGEIGQTSAENFIDKYGKEGCNLRVNFVALIPAYNEEAVIGQTIASLFNAGMPRDRVIVVNDASKDRTAEIARNLGVVVIDNTINLGKAGGVTKALHVISSDPRYKDLTHICFLDADTLVDFRYFQAMRKRLSDDIKECEKANKGRKTKRRPIGVLCGQAKSLPHNWLTAFRAYEYWLTHALHKPAQATMKAIMVAPGCASTYSLDALKAVDWNDDTVTEDMDATIQVALSGRSIVYESGAIVYTQDPRSISDYFGQVGRRWYPGTWQVMGKHKLLWRGFFSKLHWECRFMTLEPFLFIGLPCVLAVNKPSTLLWFLGTGYVTNVLLAILAAWRERRWDILKFAWIFPFIWFPSILLFVGMSWNIFGRKKSSRRWYSPERYTPNGTS